ncbi:hypothetical protein BU16DRAFT_542554 [Lophium mytilinum]|uniref:Uncharacterized protein n=1 Tax=Lophium mytilinum TaxID=390894 RepID=A0A6A6QGW7_9PEZI|nr:hypothetical protein BU16DRAFT_542554 [Lophium mytilinum]
MSDLTTTTEWIWSASYNDHYRVCYDAERVPVYKWYKDSQSDTRFTASSSVVSAQPTGNPDWIWSKEHNRHYFQDSMGKCHWEKSVQVPLTPHYNRSDSASTIGSRISSTSGGSNSSQTALVTGNDYTSVRVFLIGWQQSDINNLPAELNAIGDTFSRKFGFETLRHDLNNANPEPGLRDFLHGNNLLPGSEGMNSPQRQKELVIVLHGGHSDKMGNFSSCGQFCKDTNHHHGPSLKWKPFQENLIAQDFDCLTVLDTCFSGASARGISSKNMLLAASEANELSYNTSDEGYSFTEILNLELRRLADEGGPVSVRSLCVDRLYPRYAHQKRCPWPHRAHKNLRAYQFRDANSVRPECGMNVCQNLILRSTPNCSSLPEDNDSIDITFSPLLSAPIKYRQY